MQSWTLIEVEDWDVTDDPVPNAGLWVPEWSHHAAKALCDFALKILICICFFNTLSGMIYVDTLMGVLLRFCGVKSGDISHDKNEMSLFSSITLNVQSEWQWMSNLSLGGGS